MTVVQSLIDLQEVDGRIRELELELKDLPRRKAQETARLSDKEYQQYSIQIDLVSHDLEATENSQLAAMDDLPSAEARIADAQAKFDQEAGGVKAFCDEIDERIAAVTAELAEAQKERAEKAKLVTDPRFMLYYERLRTKRWPVVVTLTHDGVCDGCHLVQPPSVSQLVDHNAGVRSHPVSRYLTISPEAARERPVAAVRQRKVRTPQGRGSARQGRRAHGNRARRKVPQKIDSEEFAKRGSDSERGSE